jgi:hypothetical protein
VRSGWNRLRSDCRFRFADCGHNDARVVDRAHARTRSSPDCLEVEPVWRSEEQLELLLGQRGLREHREDAATVVVDDHDHCGTAMARAPEQTRCVMDHRKVAEQRVGGSAHLGDAEGRGHQAVDAAGATIGQNSQTITRAHVHVEIAYGHARPREEDAAIRDRSGQVACDPSFEWLIPGVEQCINGGAHSVICLVPLVEPLRPGCGQRRCCLTQRCRDLGRILVDGQRGATIRIGDQLIWVDDEQPVGAPDEVLDAA